MWTYFRSKLLIDGTGASPIHGGAVLVKDGVIEAVGPETLLQAPPDATRFDFGDRTILPGLIDAHVHLFGTPDPGGFVATQNEDEEWLLLRASANARQALAAGLTTVRDCGGRGSIIISLAKATAAGLAPGPRIVSCGAPITTTGGHCYYLGLEADGVEGVQKAVRQMHKAGADFIKVMVTGGGITHGSNTRASQYSQAELDAITEDAHRLGKRVAGHVHGTQGIQRAVDAGFDTLEHGSWLAANGQGRDYDRRVVEKILKQGIVVCRTIAGFERLPIEEATPEHRFWPDYEVLRHMVRDGVKLAAGTDSGIDLTPISEYAYTLETMAGLGGMSRPAVIDTATRVAAEAIGLADQIGTLQKGKRADLIAVTGNPLDDLRVLRHIDYVIRDGNIVAQDGHVVG
jgi:imidazolonepropionase-like amidohydrolase